MTGKRLSRVHLSCIGLVIIIKNNNQIYKACAELLDEGFVTKDAQHQDNEPSKKIYTITDAGRQELNDWLLSITDEPVFRKGS